MTIGILIALLATVLNGVLGRYLLRVGRTHDSAALQANGRHVVTDVWTSLGVLAGVGLVVATGWARLDPLLAMLVAAHVAREGVRVLTANLSKLMDERLPADEEQIIVDALAGHAKVLGFHRLRSRRSGRALRRGQRVRRPPA